MSESATQGADAGAATHGAVAGTNGSTVTTETGTTGVSQDEVNRIAAKARREGATSSLKSLLTEFQVESPEELRALVAAARLTAPLPEPKPKVPAAVAAAEERARKAEESAAADRAKAEAAIVRAAVLEHLSDTNDPVIALAKVLKETGAKLVVREDGTVLPVDKDGDELSTDLGKWLKAEKAKHTWLLKPNGSGSGSRVAGRRSPEEEDAEKRKAAADPEYFQKQLAGAILSSGILSR